MHFFLNNLLCFLVVVLVVVESGDFLVAWMVGEVFCCDLCDPCMMLSCAFILVKKSNILACISSLFPRISGRGITLISHVRKNDTWIIDSGCSHHMTGDKTNFEHFEDYDASSVRFGNNEPCCIKGRG